MGVLERKERDRYEEVWSNLPKYGDYTPTDDVLPQFKQVAQPGSTVLDAGCGSGKGSLSLSAAGYQVAMMCDITREGVSKEALAQFPFREACLWKPLRSQLKLGQVDWVFCADVLEHVPQQFTMLAIDQMLALAVRGVFLSIAFTQDVFGVWLGTPLHQTLQPYNWWRDSLRELGTLVDSRDQLTRGVFTIRR